MLKSPCQFYRLTQRSIMLNSYLLKTFTLLTDMLDWVITRPQSKICSIYSFSICLTSLPKQVLSTCSISFYFVKPRDKTILNCETCLPLMISGPRSPYRSNKEKFPEPQFKLGFYNVISDVC